MHKIIPTISHTYRSVFLLVLLVAFSSCSTKKNTATSRAYHNISAHYNVFFNGKESLKYGELRIEESVEDDYGRILPIFKASRELTGSVAASDMDYAIEKGLKLIKLHSITKKPKQKNNASKRYKEFRDKGEWNNWVDDAHLLMGKANFYKRQYFLSEVQLQHIPRYYKGTPSDFISRIWLARTYIEMERYMEAKDVLEKLEADRDLPRKMRPQLDLVWCDLSMRLENYEDAIPRLLSALESSLPRKDKLRYYYILAQLYQETNQPMLASATFNKLVHMRPNYKMAFYSRIQRAEMGVTEENFASLHKQLKRMLRDKKNEEFEDRIYYALGNMYWAQGKKAEAMADFRISAARSQENPDQRAQSCLRLARIYFDQKNYPEAQAYYDSTIVVIDESYPNYELIANRTDVLTQLVSNLDVIEVQDSLQKMASMPQVERENSVLLHIQELKDREARAKAKEREAQLEKYQTNNSRLTQRTSVSSSWYFYNPSTISYGKAEFERTYGRRKLADNWRRTDLGVFDFDDELLADEETDQEGVSDTPDSLSTTPVRVDDRMQLAYYTQDLPLTDSLMAVSDAMIQEAYYNAARIMRLDLQNIDQATDLYKELLRRYPKGTFELVALFDMYDVALSTGESQEVDEFKHQIVTQYPDSKYTAYILNPNFFVEEQAKQDSAMNRYARALDYYYKRDYDRAYIEASNLMETTNDSLLLPKVAFVQTVSRGTSMALVDFETSLHSYIETYPKGETAKLAEEILLLVRDRSLTDMNDMMASGYVNENIVNQELKSASEIDDGFGGKWDYTEDVFHYYVLMFHKSYNIDANRLIFDIAHFNIDYYPEDDFDVEKVSLNNQYDMVVIRSLANREEALIYFNSIIRRREVFSQFEGREYVNVVVSSNNYRTMLGDQDFREYNRFFMKHMSRYTGTIAPSSELADPMELLRRSREKKNEVKGDFVMVNTNIDGASSQNQIPAKEESLFEVSFESPHNFVLIAEKRNVDWESLEQGIVDFNKTNFGSPKIKVGMGKFDSNHLIITVSGLGSKKSASAYATKFIKERSLYKPLNGSTYRNFVVSMANQQVMQKLKEYNSYMEFYKKEYLKK